MKNKFPIYIPSKGRPASCTTPGLLSGAGLEFRIVVEPEEAEAYAKLHGDRSVLVLPESNRGVNFSRAWIKSESEKVGHEYHWQIDDDVRRFIHRTGNGRSWEIGADAALAIIENHVINYSNIGQIGMNQNSWPAGDRIIRLNKMPVQCVLNKNGTKVNYDPKYALHGDLAFTLGLLELGYCTVMIDTVRVITPPIGSNAGGLNKTYASQRKVLDAAIAICNDFPLLEISTKGESVKLSKAMAFSKYTQQPIPL